MAENEADHINSALTRPTIFWQMAFSWPSVGLVVSILLSFAGGIITSSHQYVADGFCLAGMSFLIIKFWTWEGSKHDTPRKTAVLLAGGTLALVGIGVGFCVLSSYLNKVRSTAETQPTLVTETLQKSSLPTISGPVPLPSLSAPIEKTSRKVASRVQPPEVAPAQPSVTQSGTGNQQTVQTMSNSPGGIQAGGNLTVNGPLPTPARILLPEDIEAARSILSTSKGRIEIISFPTQVPPNSEIDKFTDALSYALSQANWSVYRERFTSIGSFNGRTDMPYGPHGVGCSITDPNSDEARAALLALAKLKLHCAGQSAIFSHGETNPLTLYITVGTRIVTEQ